MAYNVGTPKGKGHQMKTVKTVKVETTHDMNDFYQALFNSASYSMNTNAEYFEDAMIESWSAHQEYDKINEQHMYAVGSYIDATGTGSEISLTFKNRSVAKYIFD